MELVGPRPDCDLRLWIPPNLTCEDFDEPAEEELECKSLEVSSRAQHDAAPESGLHVGFTRVKTSLPNTSFMFQALSNSALTKEGGGLLRCDRPLDRGQVRRRPRPRDRRVDCHVNSGKTSVAIAGCDNTTCFIDRRCSSKRVAPSERYPLPSAPSSSSFLPPHNLHGYDGRVGGHRHASSKRRRDHP